MKSLSDSVLREDLDLAGPNLVEASAGTGKTYSIETLFVRIVVAEGVSIREILVVTFTEAATKELRERLRAILERCRGYLEDADSIPPDDRLGRVLALPVKGRPDTDSTEDRGDDHDVRLRRVRRALLDFDQAAVSTIHGFCQRTLQEYAFECGHDFDAEVVQGDPLLWQHCGDWWRQVQYPAAETRSQALVQWGLPSVKQLVAVAGAVLNRPMAKVLPSRTVGDESDASVALSAALVEAARFAETHAVAIEADITREFAGLFFSGPTREEIRKLLAGLSAGAPGDPPACHQSVQRLTALLKPGSRDNTYVPPSSVAACLAAAASCTAMADRTELGIKGLSGRWQAADPETLEEWGECVEVLLRTVAESREALETFLSGTDALWYYNANDLTKPDTREKRLQVLTDGVPGKPLLTAIKRLGQFTKRRSVTWKPAPETREILVKVENAVALEKPAALALWVGGLWETLARYDQAKRETHVLTYDDMLQRLMKALVSGDRAAVLRRALRGRYRAALIDEFQDTDPIQYEIFRRIFLPDTGADGDEARLPLFFVGDPKQAIYSFRGADVYTYCQAAARVPESCRFSLDTNYRSQAPLVAAVNTIFRDRPEGPVFGPSGRIRYAGDLASGDLEQRFVDEGKIDTRPLKIWGYARPAGSSSSGKLSSAAAARIVYADVADEIARLLSSERTGFTDRDRTESKEVPADRVRRLLPSDIAILVRQHAEAAHLQRELRARGIPAVRQAGEKVFDSREAVCLRYLLRALLTPRSQPAVRTALVSTLLPVTGDEVLALGKERVVPCAAAAALEITGVPDSMDGWIALFNRCAESWLHRGFSAAFTRLMDETGMTSWLASTPGGERRLTNVLHLHDLLHRTAVEGRLGPEALVAWFQRQLHHDTRDQNDAFLTRLESDADAVQIMTLFKSKGLEFPVVFVPTLWKHSQGGGAKNVCHVYHEMGNGPGNGSPDAAESATILQLDTKDEQAKEQASIEAAEEAIRTFYVAATRAAFRTYVAAGDLVGAKGPLAACLPPADCEVWHASAETGIELCPRELSPRAPVRYRLNRFQDAGPLAAAGPAAVDASRRHASFSSIAPHGPGPGSETYDFDAHDRSTDEPEPGRPVDIFTFPAGARTGECWHRIFELLGFGASNGVIREVVNEQLGLFRLDRGDELERRRLREICFDMVRRVLHARLDTGHGSIRLADLKPNRKRAEVGFDFSLRGSGAGAGESNAIRTVLERAWGGPETPEAGEQAIFLRRLRQWQAEIPAGFMTGFIDLLFEQDGRYYLLDWKSNRLHQQPGDFDRPGLVAEMAEQAYFLQYLIYTVAADRFLSTCLGPRYDYDRDFGGVLYLFLRGVGRGEEPGDQRGVFYTKPEESLVRALANALIPGVEPGGRP